MTTAELEHTWLDVLARLVDDPLSGLKRLAGRARELEQLSPVDARQAYRHAPITPPRWVKLPTRELARAARGATDVASEDAVTTVLELVDCVCRQAPTATASRDELIRWGNTVRGNLQGQLVARGGAWPGLFAEQPERDSSSDQPRDPMALFPLVALEIFDLAVAFADDPRHTFGAAVFGAAGSPGELAGAAEQLLSEGFATTALSVRMDRALGQALAGRYGIEGRHQGLKIEAPGAIALHVRELLRDPGVVSVLDGMTKLATRVRTEVEHAQAVDIKGRQAKLVVDPRRDPGDFADDVVLRNQLQRAFRTAGLSRRQREAIVLRGLLDLPNAQIAERMGSAEGTVEAHLARAREKLAPRLEESM